MGRRVRSRQGIKRDRQRSSVDVASWHAKEAARNLAMACSYARTHAQIRGNERIFDNERALESGVVLAVDLDRERHRAQNLAVVLYQARTRTKDRAFSRAFTVFRDFARALARALAASLDLAYRLDYSISDPLYDAHKHAVACATAIQHALNIAVPAPPARREHNVLEDIQQALEEEHQAFIEDKKISRELNHIEEQKSDFKEPKPVEGMPRYSLPGERFGNFILNLVLPPLRKAETKGDIQEEISDLRAKEVSRKDLSSYFWAQVRLETWRFALRSLMGVADWFGFLEIPQMVQSVLERFTGNR